MQRAHKQLRAWQESMNLTRTIYNVTRSLPDDERFGLVAQMRRAAVSVPSNIAEGSARQSKKETVQFYAIARGSLSELDTQLEICRDLNLLPENLFVEVSGLIETVGALLNGLIRFKKKQL